MDIQEFVNKLASKITGHNDYHGDDILNAIYTLVEGKEISNIKPLMNNTKNYPLLVKQCLMYIII